MLRTIFEKNSMLRKGKRCALPPEIVAAPSFTLKSLVALSATGSIFGGEVDASLDIVVDIAAADISHRHLPSPLLSGNSPECSGWSATCSPCSRAAGLCPPSPVPGGTCPARPSSSRAPIQQDHCLAGRRKSLGEPSNGIHDPPVSLAACHARQSVGELGERAPGFCHGGRWRQGL